MIGSQRSPAIGAEIRSQHRPPNVGGDVTTGVNNKGVGVIGRNLAPPPGFNRTNSDNVLLEHRQQQLVQQQQVIMQQQQQQLEFMMQQSKPLDNGEAAVSGDGGRTSDLIEKDLSVLGETMIDSLFD